MNPHVFFVPFESGLWEQETGPLLVPDSNLFECDNNVKSSKFFVSGPEEKTNSQVIKGWKHCILWNSKEVSHFQGKLLLFILWYKMLKALEERKLSLCQGLCWELLFAVSPGLPLLFLLDVVSSRLDDVLLSLCYLLFVLLHLLQA